MAEKELAKSIREKYEKSMREYFNVKMLALILLLSIVLVFLIRLHVFSEEWAWRIAESLITIDGIVIGFVIIGITFFSPERRFPVLLITGALEKYLKDFLQELKLVEVSNRRKIYKRFLSSLSSGLAESFVVPSCIWQSMILLILSIGCALSLFGVSETTTGNAVFEYIFSSTLTFSIAFLFFALYMIYKIVQDYVFTTYLEHVDKAVEEAFGIFSKDVEDTTTPTKEE